MPITLDGSLGITTPTYGGTDTSEYLVPVTAFKNRIINGAMMIDQRYAGASYTPVNGNYSLDRWNWGVSQSSKITTQQNAGSVTPPAGFTNYLGITSSSAYSVTSGDYFYVNQRIEANNVSDLSYGTASAASVTLSFWVRSSLTGTFGGSLFNATPSKSYPFTYTISAANTWEQKTITIAGDTSAAIGTGTGIGLLVSFGLGAGSTYSGTAGSWQSGLLLTATGATSVVGTNGATFYITGVQLEKGSTATSFDYRPYGTELALCQRYYYRIKPNAGSAQALLTISGVATSATASILNTPFPVPMRIIPTSLEQTGSASDYYVWQSTARVCSAVPTYLDWTTDTFAASSFTVASGQTANTPAFGRCSTTNNAYLGWSAEL